MFTAEVDLRRAERLFAEDRSAEAEAALNRAEDKLARVRGEGADHERLNRMRGGLDQLESRNAEFLLQARRLRGKMRLQARSQDMVGALRVWEYRARLDQAAFRLVAARVRRARREGLEGSWMNPFMVDAADVRAAAAAGYGEEYPAEMERLDPGAPERAVEVAAALGGPALSER